jgi:DNA-directed RNA polymerase subunit RPC12/RpoP
MNKLTWEQKYWIMLIIVFAGCLGLALLASYISQWFIIALFVFIIAWTISAHYLLKCPKCGKNVFVRPIKIGGIEIRLGTPWIQKKCSHCGAELD